MKTQLPILITHYFNNVPIELISVCAWCPSETYPVLEKDQEYTHGMCERHKAEFIEQVEYRIRRIEKKKKKGVVFSLPKTIQGTQL